MLVNATEMLKKAKAGHYAVGQFNINNLEWTKAILQTAQELNSPVILGVSEGAGKYMTGLFIQQDIQFIQIRAILLLNTEKRLPSGIMYGWEEIQ